MNSTTQTALQLGMEYSERIRQQCLAWEALTGEYPGAFGKFWQQPEVTKNEILSDFWWQAYRNMNPYGDGTCDMEDSYDNETGY
jgi:hypothetical protein